MKKILFSIICFIITSPAVESQTQLDGNRISSLVWIKGIFDQGDFSNQIPGFEWPKGEGTEAVFTAGFTMAAKVNGNIRMAAASYTGEYYPGYILNGNAMTNSTFKIYKVKRGDTQFSNPDYANWGLMVPYGAPFQDINNNGLYEPSIDIPGVEDAAQTIFLCMTDGFPDEHSSSEGFGGGTVPMMAEVHLTAWCYDSQEAQDVQFLKWEVINKSSNNWEGAIFTIFSDPDVGNAVDDWVGCDTALNLAYCYNSDNNDEGVYGINPPAVGFSYLKTPMNNNQSEYGATSFIYSRGWSNTVPCEIDPNTPSEAYNFMKGLKNDGTPWLNAVNQQITKFCYTGDPESGAGWTEADGRIENCGGNLTGTTVTSTPGDRRMCLNTGDTNLVLGAGDTAIIVVSQQIARGNNNLNSVTKLKQLTQFIQNNWQTIGITPISSEVPESFRLHQNYPNPFNPATKIRFEIPLSVKGQKSEVKLYVYDIAGKEVARLVNQELTPGVYEYDFDGSGLSSGMYFYRLSATGGAGSYIETKKMVLIK